MGAHKKQRIFSILAILTMAVILTCIFTACGETEAQDVSYIVTIHPCDGELDIVWDAKGEIPYITREGYYIAGYYLDEDFTINTTLESLKAIGLTKNLDVYIKWAKDVCVHVEVTDAAVSPTCTTTGLTEGKHCSVCKEILQAQTVIPALGHDLVSHEAKHPTCTEPGWIPYKTCTRCDYTTYVEIKKKDHTESDWIIDNVATCTKEGTKHIECTECHTILQTGTIPKTEHIESDWITDVDSTCSKEGRKIKVCTGCNMLMDENVVPVKSHFDNAEWRVDKAPTCTETGDYRLHCKYCDIFLKYQSIPALGHDLEHHDAKPATCTEAGWNEYDTCKRDGCNYSTYKEIAAIGHKESDWITDVEPTCTEDGTKHTECAKCHTVFKTSTISATGHSYGDWIIDVASTCEKAGSMHKECERCGATENSAIKALGHNLEHHDAKGATCTEIGWEAYDKCTRCDYSTYEEIAATEHSEGDWTTDIDPTCTEDGAKHTECTKCHIVLQTGTIPATGHSYGDWIIDVASTCEKAGSMHKECDRCGATENAMIKALGHNLEHHDAKGATCTEIGWEAYDKCTRCDYSTYKEISANGHKESDWIIDENANCTVDGSKHTVCTVCNTIVQTEVLPAIGHSYSDAWMHDETYHWHDATCGHDVTSDKAKHTYDEEWNCTVCGYNDDSLHGTDIETNTLILENSNIRGKVPNNQDVFSFIDEIKVADGATFTVSTDINGSNVIRTKTVNLAIGDNTYYILVENGKDIKLYNVSIRRRPIYTVTFNTNGGTEVKPQQVEEDNFATEPTTERVGYTFDKWDWDFDNAITDNTTVTANWNVITYNIVYDFNVPTESLSQYVDNSMNVTMYTIENEVVLAAPTRRGYTFIGWTGTDLEECTMSVVIPIGSCFEKRYTANWQANVYTLHFDANGGDILIDSQSVVFDSHYSLPVATRVGYSFLGWYNDSSRFYDGIWGFSMDFSLTAKWEANTDTVYTVNHYRENADDDEYTLYATQTLQGTSDADISPDVNSYLGFLSPEKENTTISADGSRVVNYYYTRIKYVLTVNTNTGDIKTFTVKYGESINNSAAITREGYTFGGYYEDVALSKKVTVVFCNKTVYTWWQEEQKPSVFSYNGTDSITLTNYIGKDTDVIIPAYIGNVPVRVLLQAVSNKSVKSVVIPNTVTDIGKMAFHDCDGLKNIIIPDSVKTIGDHAFDHCSSIVNIVIPNSVTSIGLSAFEHCEKLTSVTISGSVKKVGEYAFYTCSNLTELIIEDGVEIIDGFAFQYCEKLVRVNVPDSVTSIGDSAFRSCTSLTDVFIGNGVKNIMYAAFFGCTNLSNIMLGDNVTHIGEIAFEYCSSLTEITFPATLKSIGTVAFDGCKALKDVYYNGTIEDWCGISGLNYLMSSTRTLYIGDKPVKGYLKISDGVTSISNSAFSYCEGITGIILPSSIVSIGESAFHGCSKLKEVAYAAGEEQWNNISIGAQNEKLLGATIIYNCDNDAAVKFSFVTNCDQQIGEIESVRLLSLPTLKTRVGYVFDGWYDNSNFSGDKITAPYSSKEDVCLFAKWELIAHTITYVLNGWTNPEGNKTTYTIKDGTFALLDGVNGNNLFCGWYLDEEYTNCVETINASTMKDYVVYAMPDCGATKGLIIQKGAVKSYSGTETDVIIPTYYKGYPVTSVDMAFQNNKSVTSVVLPNSMVSVGYRAFMNCENLTSVEIPQSVTAIEEAAFSGCKKLSSCLLPNGLLSIGYGAFKNCISFTEVTIPESLTLAERYSFSNCSGLKVVNWYATNCLADPESDSDDDQIFGYCTNLTTVNIGENVISIPGDAFYYCTGLTSITIPKNVNMIQSCAFEGCSNLIEVINKSSLEIVAGSSSNGYVAYYAKNVLTGESESNITTTSDGFVIFIDGEERVLIGYTGNEKNITVPSNITRINNKVFAGHAEIESIIIPYSVAIDIGDSAFSGCTGLTSITIPDSVTSIGSSAFSGCIGLTDITIPDGVTSIDIGAFQGCTGLTSVTIPERVTSVGLYAFFDCTRLASVNWNAIACASVGSSVHPAFENCKNLTRVNIGENVTIIPSYAFYNCTGLTSISIPDSVTSIGAFAFSECAGLTSVTIGNGVKSISSGVFQDCSSLENITIPFVGENNTASSDYNRVFGYMFGYTTTSSSSSTVSGATLQYSYSGMYDDVYYWYYIPSSLKSVVISDGATSIPDRAFYNCTGLTSIIIPDSVTSIGDWTFYECTGLTSITIPDSVTSIGASAFFMCTGLTSVEISDSVTSIDLATFSGCTGLTGITIPDSVSSIGNQAFAYCIGLTSLTIPNSVGKIGNYAFYGCSGLTSIVIPDSVTSIGGRAFEDTAWYDNQPDGLVYAGKVAYRYKGTMPANMSIIIKNGTLGIATSAFAYCTGLTSITIPDSVTSIGELSFSDCAELTSISIAEGNTKYHSEGNCIIETESKTLVGGCKNSIIPTDGSMTSIGDQTFSECYVLKIITYNGTKAQWNAISKGSNWNYKVPSSCMVYCTDGIISI